MKTIKDEDAKAIGEQLKKAVSPVIEALKKLGASSNKKDSQG